ncbi:MAG: 2,3-diphosphoglycerate-dependent phosphoglycerate mutase [Candidatus Pacebacteria bacterium]|nr:2,3-diphosphoglycerate-dependent phosphoglycerate mutase [Candidatus Paceibacterota bacterium]
MKKLVFLRHGESQWNKENKFTGWTDVDLSERGIKEASEAGKLLKEEGYFFDVAFTSVLKRATRTLDIILEELGQTDDIPVHRSWRLNERNYGALQGLNKRETAEKEGEDQVLIWRRSFDIRPPEITKDDPRWSGNDELYKDVDEKYLPFAESLKDTIERVVPYWENNIVPELKAGKKILISGHGSGLRAFKTFLDKMPPEEVVKLNIPYTVPLVYEFDDDLNVIRSYYLGDSGEIEKVIKEVEQQGKVNAG